MLSEHIKNGLYLGHALIVWAGGGQQIWHVYHYQSAQDITLFWVGCLLLAEFLALPRTFSSRFWVWKFCHIVSAILVSILLVGVIFYGG